MSFELTEESDGKLSRLKVNTHDKNDSSDKTTRVAQYEITSDADPTLKRILTIVYDKDYVNPDFK